MIDFNSPYITGNELKYIKEAFDNNKLSGNGEFTKKCQDFFQVNYNFKKALLTTSCTDALEMTSILANILPGDEVIMPSYTFVSTANAFVLQGAKIVFADSRKDNPNIDETKIEELITNKTKAIVVVHYAGIACDMEKIRNLAEKYELILIEDAAQAIDSYYKNTPLGSIGDFGTFSFHETKNIISGEGGMLIVNNEKYRERSEIIWEKGTNRSAFFRGEVDKYGWVDKGSSYLPSEITAAFLWAQLENLQFIQNKRKEIWDWYFDNLVDLNEIGKIKFISIPDYATNNAHMFVVLCNNLNQRSQLISFLKSKRIHSVFHYLPLHKSPYYLDKHDGRILPECDRYSDTLLRLPFHLNLKKDSVDYISNSIKEFFKNE